jgi:hypothetical protein
MAEKAALETSVLPVPHDDQPLSSTDDRSDGESFHSTSSRMRSKPVSRPKATRRRTMSDPKIGNAALQARTRTWPRCASSPIAIPSPSIPSRRSSHLSTSPRNRADLQSFHRQSCRLFSSMDAAMTDSGYSSIHKAGSSRFNSTTSLPPSLVPGEDMQPCSIAPFRPPVATVVSWKSEETRRIEYEKIDEAHSGLRGIWKKVLPKCCHSRRSWRRFFEGGSCDGESVRRMRMPFSEEI